MFLKIVNYIRGMKIKLLFIGLFVTSNFLLSQTNSKKQFLVNTIPFYNVENLFDTINDPKTRDDDRTPKERDKWTNIIYQKKLKNIAKVIADIG